MNRPAAQVAKSRENLAQLNALFARLEQLEPKLTSAAAVAFGAEIERLMPRLRSYALEAHQPEVEISMSLVVHFSERRPRVVLRATVVPPPREHVTEVAAK